MVSRPRPQYSCYKTANRALRDTATIIYRHPYAGNWSGLTYQQQFAQLHHVVLIVKHRGYRDVGVSACAVSANVT